MDDNVKVSVGSIESWNKYYRSEMVKYNEERKIMRELFEKLKRLTELDDGIFTKSVGTTENGIDYVIFDHFMMNYTTWQENPEALESRGIMFEINKPTQSLEDVIPLRIMSRPMKKFFNFAENPSTMVGINYDDIASVYDKADGSIITTYLYNDLEVGGRWFDNYLGVKSRNSVQSKQAKCAFEYIWNNKPLYNALLSLTAKYDCSFDMEYMSPSNRIVLLYPEDNMIIHNARNNVTGEFLDIFEMAEEETALKDYLPVHREDIALLFKGSNTFESTKEIIKNLQSELVAVEGFVINMKDGQRFKIKTDWYCDLHRVKDGINSDRGLWKSVVHGTSDDVKAMLSECVLSVERIEYFENYFINKFNGIRKEITGFWEEHGVQLFEVGDRGAYARKAKEVGTLENHDGMTFICIMELYKNMLEYGNINLKHVEDKFMLRFFESEEDRFIAELRESYDREKFNNILF